MQDTKKKGHESLMETGCVSNHLLIYFFVIIIKIIVFFIINIIVRH